MQRRFICVLFVPFSCASALFACVRLVQKEVGEPPEVPVLRSFQGYHHQHLYNGPHTDVQSTFVKPVLTSKNLQKLCVSILWQICAGWKVGGLNCPLPFDLH